MKHSTFKVVKCQTYGKPSFILGPSQCFKKSIKSLKSQLAILGSKLTISFHNLDPRYENNWLNKFHWSPCVDVQLDLKMLWGSLHLCHGNICMSPKAVALVYGGGKVLDLFPFSNSSYDSSYISWKEFAAMPFGVFSSLLLLVIPQKCHASGQYSKLLLIKLLQIMLLDFVSVYFEILTKVLSCCSLNRMILYCSITSRLYLCCVYHRKSLRKRYTPGCILVLNNKKSW